MSKKLIIFIILIFNILLISCLNEESIDKSIVDNNEVYISDNLTSIKEIYITVLEANKNSNNYKYTLSQINSNSIENRAYEDGKLKIIFQEGNNGKVEKTSYGYGITDSNGTMELRGQSAKFAPLKSYKVELNSKLPWDNYTTVNLNKHPFDDLRIRNKLAFEIIKDIPNLVSARTQFIHLFVRDFSEGDYTKEFEDYGLFTQIENIDTDYLENHNLDKNGHLYKVENFEFRRYENILLNSDDPDYDEDAFEEILEIKGDDNHTKLLEMLDDVNNYNININTIIDEHFDRENLLTWLALNIVTDNIDTQSRNYFIYSPSDSMTWYFIPWDYDKALGGYTDDRPTWSKGISNYWGIVLINRFLKNNQNLQDLKLKIEELELIINQEKLDKYIESLKPIIYEYLTKAPDNTLESSLSREELDLEINKLKNSINTNINYFNLSIDQPMPLFLFTPTINGNFIEFNWGESYSFNQELIYYDFSVSKNPSFTEIVYEANDLIDNERIIEKLSPGIYYYKVVAKDKDKHEIEAFDIFYDENTNLYFDGIKKFVIY